MRKEALNSLETFKSKVRPEMKVLNSSEWAEHAKKTLESIPRKKRR